MRLERFVVYSAPTAHKNFTSIKVRLDQQAALDHQLQKQDFNSIKVRLEPLHHPNEHKGNADFNSIKVRLEL